MVEIIGGGHINHYTARDEWEHPIGDHQWWNESVWMHFLDMESGIHGIMRVGHQANLNGGQTNRVGLISTPDWLWKSDGSHPMTKADRLENGFAAAGTHRFEYDDKVRWTLRDTDLEADLVMDDYHPPIGFHPANGPFSSIAPHHAVAAGTVRGTIRIKGQEFTLTKALAYRDHSWGIRLWDNIRTHRWTGTTFGPDLSCNIVNWYTPDGQLWKWGYVRRNDQFITLDQADVLAYIEPDGISHRGGLMTMALADGTDMQIHCTPVNKAVITRHPPIAINDTICVARYDGREGMTCFETTNNSQGGSAMPPQQGLVRAVVDNGIHPNR